MQGRHRFRAQRNKTERPSCGNNRTQGSGPQGQRPNRQTRRASAQAQRLREKPLTAAVLAELLNRGCGAPAFAQSNAPAIKRDNAQRNTENWDEKGVGERATNMGDSPNQNGTRGQAQMDCDNRTTGQPHRRPRHRDRQAPTKAKKQKEAVRTAQAARDRSPLPRSRRITPSTLREQTAIRRSRHSRH